MKEAKLFQERFEDVHILDELKNSYLNYAMSVIVSRALPDVRDGVGWNGDIQQEIAVNNLPGNL